MKSKIYFLLLTLVAWSFQSCDNDDDKSIKVPVDIQNAFSAKYPNITRVEWETKSEFYVADFRDNTYDASAWFTANGIWKMTEIDIPFTALPDVVKRSFEGSEYASASWKVDDVDKLERQELETVYIIEVESNSQEVDLYYAEDGILIKAEIDVDNDDYSPSIEPSTVIEAFIKDKYPTARIVEIDVKHGMTEVEIIHENIAKEILFNGQNAWISTSWDVLVANLPAAVKAKVSTQYASYHIDDAEYFDVPEGQTDYFFIELEKQGSADVKLKITADGNIL